jgi:hypothetical protein
MALWLRSNWAEAAISRETLLEEVWTDKSLITLRPVRAESSNLFATNVCFDDADTCSGELRLVGLEFASDNTLAGVAPIGDSDRDVLASVDTILRRRGKTKRFGIRLLHDPLNLDDGVLFETCDPIHRVLMCRSGTQDDPALAQSIATVFRWEVVQARSTDGLVVGQGCIQFCRSVQRCVLSVHGSHEQSSTHEPTGHRSV